MTRPRTGAGRPPYLYDPRPDLAADTRVWQALLELAFLLDGEAPDGLFGALHGVRCCGARLVPAGRGYRLSPGTEYLGGAAAWTADRTRWLLPRGDVLTPLLRGLRDAPEQSTRSADAHPSGRASGVAGETDTSRGDDHDP